ncbi:hypothetical protein [Humisphaera borealis]|uniref:NolW-like domain-containing protein n=1 Tax=Humisphaera borealis TaxID=2807512 RepID=A0A7M2WXM3_9BACT|nr:hypothetical protein [Humisphaera borealis]QOV90277.1 hypothetical protein IPV69_02580 [Humisphaera borealis]
MTRLQRFLGTALCVPLTANPLFAQQSPPANDTLPPAAVAADPAAPAEAPAPVDGRSTVIGEVKFEAVRVEDVITFLQDVSKGYRAVIVRKGKSDDEPLVTMRLKNVSVQQILDVITTAYGGIEVTPVDGPNGPVDVISILPRAAVDADAAPAGAAPAEPERAVRVYRLSGIVQMMAPKAEKDALANVLSVIKATIEMTAGREAPTIQLHEETHTLIFKGSQQQRLAVEDVLSALESDRAVRGAGGEGQGPADFSRLRKQLEDARAELEKSRQEGVLLRTEVDAIQRQREFQARDQQDMKAEYLKEIQLLRAELGELQRQTAKPK